MNWHVFLLPYGVELCILRKNDVQGVTPLEERYMKVSRRPAGRRQAPPQRRQTGPDRRRTEADDWDEPPRKRGRSGRSPAAAVAVGFYKVLVLVSALIVAAYLGFSFMIKAPEQKAPPPPVPLRRGSGAFVLSYFPLWLTYEQRAPGVCRRPLVFFLFTGRCQRRRRRW